jgi:pimeloyl-ACP methyl ester carboxylesterase
MENDLQVKTFTTLTIIPGGRHLTPVECPDQIAEQLLALLERI